MATLRDAEGRQLGMILHTMGGMQDQIQTREKSLREETHRVADANTKLAQREHKIESLKQVVMDEVLEASHVSAAAKKDRDLVARLSRVDEMLQMHSPGMQVSNETAAQAEEMVIRSGGAGVEAFLTVSLPRELYVGPIGGVRGIVWIIYYN